MAPSAQPRSAKDTQNHSKSQSKIKQESADNDSSAWNVVVGKRQHAHPSSRPTHGWGNKSKQQTQKTNAGRPQNSRQRFPKKQQTQQHQRSNNTHNQSSTNAKHYPNPSNHRKNQQTSASNENAMKKNKPKPKAMTVGDMLPLSNKKKFNKDSTKKVSHQQNQSKTKIQRQQQNYADLHTESVQDFPALGAGNFPSLPQSSVSAVPRKGWGTVPKPSPVPANTAFQFNNNISAQNNIDVAFPEPTMSSKVVNTKSRASTIPRTTQQQPTRVLKKGEKIRSQGVAVAASNKKRKQRATIINQKTKHMSQEVASSAASFFQPRPRNPPLLRELPDSREMEGEEHELLRLVQERNVYQKRGRQRVAPRKKKFTALKKKVLQERLDQWRALHPEEVPDTDENKNHGKNSLQSGGEYGVCQVPLITRSVCLYNYAEPDELEDDDEYEEILENLTSMATKIGPINEVFLPRNVLERHTIDRLKDDKDASDGDYPYRHPVFVLFEKESDASAALACWSDWLIGGKKLEVFGLEINDTTESPSSWSERALVAESNRGNKPGKAVVAAESRSMEILLQKVLTEDDYEDEDCMSESLADLRKIALRFGAVGNIQAAGKNGDVLVTYDNSSLEEAREIAQELCRVVVGGQPLYASVCEALSDGPVGCSTVTRSTLLLENVLTEDDLQDSDCLQESLNDIKELCMRYGNVLDVVAKGSGVKVTYQNEGENKLTAQTAVSNLNGIVLGGNTVRASVLTATNGDDNPLDSSIDLFNLITKDDMDDEECMEESISDVERLASKYGEVVGTSLCKAEGDSGHDPTKAFVRIEFASDDPSIVAKALGAFNGMVIGGQIISASLSGSKSTSQQPLEMTNPGDKRKPMETPHVVNASKETDKTKKARTDDKEPLYSGDKLISERFAEMKRVPKIPNKEGPRAYASNAPTDERIKPLLTEMLGELMRLQKRAIEDKNAKARRRMVMGLREVARGIRAHKGTYQKSKKCVIIYESQIFLTRRDELFSTTWRIEFMFNLSIVKMVVMANNLDQYGAIDEKLQEIIDLAKSEGVPLFFEFTKRSLGKALGKSIKIAVVGIQNADGAHQPFKKLNAIANRY